MGFGRTSNWQATTFDYRTLLDYYNRGFGVFGLPGVTFMDLDESHGRNVYGVIDAEVGACVQDRLLDMEIPKEAFVTELSEYTVYD